MVARVSSLIWTVLLLLVGLWGVSAGDVTVSELREELKLLLRETTDGLKQRLEISEMKNAQLAESVATLQDRVKQMEQQRAQRQLLVNPKPEIAFMATVTADEHHLHIDQPIIHDYVITNIGNAYNPKTGLFHCPVSGTYLFNFNIVAADSDYVEASLIVNGNHVVHALSDQHAGGTTWDMGTTNAIIRLIEGDVVSVGIQWPQGENTVHGNKYTTFSGYLLRAL